MSRIVTFGLGGWCENCDETHDHPLHNIVEIVEAQAWAVADEPVADETPVVDESVVE